MLMNSNLQRKGGRGGEEEMKEIEKTRKERRLNRKMGRKFSSRRHVFYLEAREASHQGNESRLEDFFFSGRLENETFRRIKYHIDVEEKLISRASRHV